MKEITIRQADGKDSIPCMMELIHELAEYEKRRMNGFPEHFTESGFGGNPVCGPGVAEVHEDGKPLVRVCIMGILQHLEKGKRLYLEDIIITGSLAGKGVGKCYSTNWSGSVRKKQFSGMAGRCSTGMSLPSISIKNTWTWNLKQAGWTEVCLFPGDQTIFLIFLGSGNTVTSKPLITPDPIVNI